MKMILSFLSGAALLALGFYAATFEYSFAAALGCVAGIGGGSVLIGYGIALMVEPEDMP